MTEATVVTGIEVKRCPGRPRVNPIRFCVDCAKQLGQSSRSAERCWSCYVAQRPTKFCADCGERTSHRSKQANRCLPCHRAWKRSTAGQRLCSVGRCGNVHKAKGLCAQHYAKKQRKESFRRAPGARTRAKRWVKSQPCQMCGYSRLPSQAHRPQAGGPYAFGNMTALCANCHGEVHAGLTPCPEPLQPPD